MSLICTCSEIRILDIEGEKPCPIHLTSPTRSPKESFLQDANGILIVCVCEEDCKSCRYTKLETLIKNGIPFKPYYIDKNNHLQEIKQNVTGT